MENTKIIIISGKESDNISKNVFKILAKHFCVKKISDIGKAQNSSKEEILVSSIVDSEKDFLQTGKAVLMFKEPILIAASFGQFLEAENCFEGEENYSEKLEKIIEKMPEGSSVILNYDDKYLSKIKKSLNCKIFKFGFSQDADFMASDYNRTDDTCSFKLNYKGSSIPIWLDKETSKENIYDILPAICAGIILGLNIIEIAEILKKESA